MDSSSFHRSFWPQITKQIGKIQSSKSGLGFETIDVKALHPGHCLRHRQTSQEVVRLRKQALAEVDRLKKHQQQVGSSAKLLDAGRIIEAADAWNLLDKAFQAQPAPPGTLRRIVQQEIKVMHDLGKYSEGFQARLDDNSIRGINHWAAGARKAFELKAPLVAYAIDGHHSGLPEAGHLLESMTKMADAVLAPAHFTTQFEV